MSNFTSSINGSCYLSNIGLIDILICIIYMKMYVGMIDKSWMYKALIDYVLNRFQPYMNYIENCIFSMLIFADEACATRR